MMLNGMKYFSVQIKPREFKHKHAFEILDKINYTNYEFKGNT